MKAKFSALIVLGILFGCENQKEAPSEPSKNLEAARYEKISSELNLQFSDAFDNAKNIKPLTLTSRTEKHGVAKLEMEDMFVSSGEYLIKNYYKGFKISDATSLYHGVALSDDISNARKSEDAAVAAINDIPTFNDEQKKLMNSLVREISRLSELNSAVNLISAYNEKVAMSATLIEEQKVQLLAFSALSSSFVKFMNEDGVSQVYDSMAKVLGISTPTNARVSGCSVNWRSVWIGAVIGAGGGAVAGVKTGLAGGTIALPGIGSVTGGVAGGIFGLAGGFAGGTLTGVAQELLGSCFRAEIRPAGLYAKNFSTDS